jgi:hypothetical protein
MTNHLPRAAFMRALPITRWVARTERDEAYYFWQHEKLGWWVWSDALAKPGQSQRWRPIVPPLVLAVSEGEPLTLTFVDWPATGLAEHDWWHEVGPVARLACNVTRGWPSSDPPVAALLEAAA